MPFDGRSFVRRLQDRVLREGRAAEESGRSCSRSQEELYKTLRKQLSTRAQAPKYYNLSILGVLRIILYVLSPSYAAWPPPMLS